MFPQRRLFLIRLVLTLIVPALLLPPSVGVAQAAGRLNGTTPGCMRCGGGGGGGGAQLTAAEIEGLTYMREEEKLARDAYLTLYARWHLPIFTKIANSESMHMAKMKELLDRYGLPDPAAGKPVGAFTNPHLQQLYNDLMVQGNLSSTEALRVGVAIEEVDIRDLQRYLGLTNKADIISAYNMLLNGSYCHLRMFNGQLGQ